MLLDFSKASEDVKAGVLTMEKVQVDDYSTKIFFF